MDKTYKVQIKYVFEGYFEVKAENKAEAKEKVENSCGVTIGDIHSSLPDHQVYWDFDVHPEDYKIKSIRLKKKKPLRKEEAK